MSPMQRQVADDIRRILGVDGVLRRHLFSGLWYVDGQGGLTDRQVKRLVEAGVLVAVDRHVDQFKVPA